LQRARSIRGPAAEADVIIPGDLPGTRWKDTALEGVYLSSLLPGIVRRILDRRTEGLAMLSRRTAALLFDDGALLLDPGTGGRGVAWLADLPPREPMQGCWDEHVRGASVVSVGQQGTDRVLEIGLRPAALYGAEGSVLVLEATGRDGNLVLVRSRDGRILAALRKVSGRMSRFRTVAPGAEYRPPPPSGAALPEWCREAGIRDALSGRVTESDVYSMLEGVGPVTARALIAEAGARGTSVHDQVCRLADALREGRFRHWMGPDGPLPIELGPGNPIDDPLLAPGREGAGPGRASGGTPAAAEFLEEAGRLGKRISKLEEVIRGLVPGEVYRRWGELILSAGGGRKRGQRTLEVTDWEGVNQTIPLRESRTLVENAGRYFRKAANASVEREHLEASLEEARTRLAAVEKVLSGDGGGAADLLRGTAGRSRRQAGGGRERKLLEIALGGGWRCMAGRNAADNDRVTFEAGKKGDYWFHARGTSGAHVVLKMDGRGGPPPARVVRAAAAVAASRSGISSGVVPVDYTEVQHVRRTRGGRPGQVVYTREKTLFIDLDRKSPTA
jgi:hypothetical protein